MQPTSQRALFWIYDDKTATHPQSIDDESTESIFPAAFREIHVPATIVAICLVSTYLFESLFFQACFEIASIHLVTRLVKKLFADYTFMHSLEEQALTITRRMPYLYLLLTTITLLFAWHLPLFSMASAASLGTLSGLAVELYSRGAACDLEKRNGDQ